MNRGFLLVDQKMNTVIIPIGDEDLSYYLKNKELINHVKQHDNLKSLDADIRKYIKGNYEQD